MQLLKSISARTIAAITLVAAGSCAVIAGFGMWQQQATVEIALERELRADYASLVAAINDQTRTAQAVSNALAFLPPLKRAVAARDRDATMMLLKDVMKEIAARGLELITIHVPPSIAFARVHNPVAFGDNVGKRRKMVLQSFATGKSLGGVEPGLEQLNIFATTALMDGDSVIGLVDIGAPFGKAFVAGIKSRLGLDVAIHSLVDGADKVLASTLSSRQAETDAVRRALSGEVFLRQGQLDGHPAATAFGPILSFSGEPIAVLEIVRDTTVYGDLARRSLLWLALATGGALILAGGVAFLIGRSLARPIQLLEAAMREIASGRHQVEVPGAARGDEIGSMAKAVEVFKEGLVETGRLRGAQEQSRSANEADRRQAMQDLAARFEAGVGGVVDQVSSAATELRTTADSMAGTARESERRIVTVTGASAQASANAQAVAAAVEQLDASISEIGQRVDQSAKVASEAAGQAHLTNDQVRGLADAAQKIGDVVTLISSIAAQTNLLALNATIEAARAGEAGRGFAVVASEVKALASQTSKATEEISSQVGAIQAATQNSVAAIEAITATIGRVNEIATAIASAVAEQGTATREIAHNVAEAARSTGEVSDNIGGVNQAAQQTGVAAAQVVSAAGELSRSGETLKTQVEAFLREVRAA